ncbi:MAG: hypothetical protein GC180_09125 [Bacteroidetes bacterium]|nr:hypothetical protein [Bacteroidota bacterium]
MDAKLTLKLDQEAIERAKSYALKHGLSLSRLIENYFNHLEAEEQRLKISPFIQSIASGTVADGPLEYKKQMRDDYEA